MGFIYFYASNVKYILLLLLKKLLTMWLPWNSFASKTFCVLHIINFSNATLARGNSLPHEWKPHKQNGGREWTSRVLFGATQWSRETLCLPAEGSRREEADPGAVDQPMGIQYPLVFPRTMFARTRGKHGFIGDSIFCNNGMSLGGESNGLQN